MSIGRLLGVRIGRVLGVRIGRMLGAKIGGVLEVHNRQKQKTKNN